MTLLRWLWPGIGIKRWLLLFVVGLVSITTGLAVLLGGRALVILSDWVRTAVFWLTGDFLTPLGRGSLLVAIGVALAAAGAAGFARAVGGVLLPDRPGVADALYERKYLERGPKIVALGGGTGLATLLRGLKMYTSNITAIVTVTDDGGSSGRLRGELGLPPPGDIRNCLVALADTEPLMESLFQHRFTHGGSLEGHSFGNLFIAAMAEVTGDFELAIRESSRVLAIRGTVLPSTDSDVVLGAAFSGGGTATGETALAAAGRRIERVWLEPADARPLDLALARIAEADVIVLGPGSVYTSVIPNLLVKGIAAAIKASPAPVFYVANIMTQHGETDGYGVADHVRAVLTHAGRQLIDVVVVNDSPVPQDLQTAYAAEQAIPVALPVAGDDLARQGVRVVRGHLLAVGPLARHDSYLLAQLIMNEAVGRHSRNRRVRWLGFMWLAEHLHLRRARRQSAEPVVRKGMSDGL